MRLPGCRPQDASDAFDQALPAVGFGGELFSSGGCQAIEFGFSIVFGCTPEGGDPAAVFEAIESRVEGTVFHLEDFIGAEFDGVGDGVPVGGADYESAEDQHVESALEQIAFRFGFLWHVPPCLFYMNV